MKLLVIFDASEIIALICRRCGDDVIWFQLQLLFAYFIIAVVTVICYCYFVDFHCKYS